VLALTSLAALSLFASATAGQESQAPAAASSARTATQVFDDCRAQEKLGDGCSCWRLFNKKFPKPSAGEAAVVETKLAACGKVQTAGKATETVKPVFPPRTVDDDKCYMGHKQDGPPSAILGDLVKKCGAPGGMVKMTSILEGAQRASDREEKYQVHLDPDECYRFFVVGDSGIESLKVGVFDPSGALVATEVDSDRIKILPPKQLFCPKVAGVYKIMILVAEGGGRYAVQGWKRPANSPAPTGSGRQTALLDIP